MEKIKNLIQEVKKTLVTVQVFLRRNKWVLPAVVSSIVVIPIAIDTYNTLYTLYGPHVVVYNLKDLEAVDWGVYGLLQRDAERKGIEGVIRGGIDGKLQGMLDRGAYRQGAIAPPP
jgi:hypothetical protein